MDLPVFPHEPPEQERFQQEPARDAVRFARSGDDFVKDRQAVEDIILASEQKYQLLVEAIPHMVWMTDNKGRTNYLNHRAEIRLGLQAKSLFGWNWLDLVHPDERDQARKLWEVSIQIRGEYRNEYRLWVAEGKYRWFLAKAMPLQGKDGEVDRHLD